jgi:hypothetical protein
MNGAQLKLRRLSLSLAVAALAVPVAQANAAIDTRPRMEPPCAGILSHSPTFIVRNQVLKRCGLPPLLLRSGVPIPLISPAMRTPVP